MIHLRGMLRVPLTLLRRRAVFANIMQHAGAMGVFRCAECIRKRRCTFCNATQVFTQFLI